MLDLSKIDSAAKKLAEIKRFRSTATATSAICWVLHAGIDLFEAEAAKEQGDVLFAKVEMFLAENQLNFSNGHRKRLSKGGYKIGHASDIDLLIEAGAEVIEDKGKQVILRLVRGEQPVTRYRSQKPDSLDDLRKAAEARRLANRAARDEECRARRGDAPKQKATA